MPLVTIPQGRIGYVFARDGVPLPPTRRWPRTRATRLPGRRAFLPAGGQKGPQRKVLREGAYAINLAQFVVVTRDDTFACSWTSRPGAARPDGRDHRGPPRLRAGGDQGRRRPDRRGHRPRRPRPASGEIIAPAVGTTPETRRPSTTASRIPRSSSPPGAAGPPAAGAGRGTYFINRLFATVETIAKTVVEVGQVGVCRRYTGAPAGHSGEGYRHGELVETGRAASGPTRCLPGKYAFNTYAGRITMVPTTNFILKWETAAIGSHKFDENLAEVSLITKDAFEPTLPVSVVVHIDYRKAPLVIQRFGDIKKLVEQTLDPMVSAYFKNIGQTATLIELLQDRSEIQQISSQDMKTKFAVYNLELQEVLIGTPRPGRGAQRRPDREDPDPAAPAPDRRRAGGHLRAAEDRRPEGAPAARGRGAGQAADRDHRV
jgi:hypothetical protein